MAQRFPASRHRNRLIGTGAAMTDDLPAANPFAQPPLIRALLIARYALVIHGGMMVTCEGKSWNLDFAAQIAEIDEALQSEGIDTTKPMLAPVRWADG